MVLRGVSAAVVGCLMLAGCGGLPTSSPSMDAYMSDLIRAGDPINGFCVVLKAKADAEKELPALLNCGRDNSVPGTTVLMMVWQDPAANAVKEKLTGLDWPFAMLTATADLFASQEKALSKVDILFFAIRDECRNTIEMPATVAAQLGNGELTLEQAAAKSEIVGDVGC